MSSFSITNSWSPLHMQGSTNCAHGDERTRKEVVGCTKLRERKSIKTLLGTTPMSFKIVSYFYV